jgi:exodeoxyribonuclease V alpha subunit
LTTTAVELLGIGQNIISPTIDQMLNDEDIIRDEPDSLYIPPLYYSEIGVARRLSDIHSAAAPKIPSGIGDYMDALLEKIRGQQTVEYSGVQKNAIKQSLLSKILVVTGGPGTGKTTTILGIISLLKQFNLEILLAAPTGRAAKRMTETCGFEAKTIHRLLGYKPPNGYEHDGDNPICGDVLIIDECSMIDVVLMNSLLKAVPGEMKVILVGDIDQLPSVGPGNVLSDIIYSNVIPVVKLDTIFRQAQSSDIIKNAHLINKGKFPSLNNGKKSDFFFIEQEDNTQIPQTIVELCMKRLPKHYGVNPIHDIQVLCPMTRSENGSSNLNMVLQGALNPNTAALKRGGTEYRLGDKVMQIKNDYDKNVFNGDIGIIKSINLESRNIIVDFDNHDVEYDISELDELVLSYAITIHKSQGSEYPIVIMPFTMQFFVMLQRNLLYTGITRAKRVIVLVGSKKAVGCAVRNADVVKRNTGLAKRLTEMFNNGIVSLEMQ